MSKIRDSEIARLRKYAEGLGLYVYFRPYVPFSLDAAGWDIEGRSIVVYIKNNTTKTDIILALIHEIGHQLTFLYKNKKFPKLADNALEKEIKNRLPNKKERKAILDWEIEGMEYHMNIYKECDIKIPEWKVHYENDYQLFIYNHWYKTGKIPTIKQKIEKKRELLKKYKV